MCVKRLLLSLTPLLRYDTRTHAHTSTHTHEHMNTHVDMHPHVQQCDDTFYNTSYTLCYNIFAVTVFPRSTLIGAFFFCFSYFSTKKDKHFPMACHSIFSGRSTISNKSAQSPAQHTGSKLELTDSKRRKRETYISL